jgi:hypothetical protein
MSEPNSPLPHGLNPGIRQDHEQPPVSTQLGWRFHHVGIPTTRQQSNEVYLKQFGMYVSGFRTSPFGIEWMRFDSDSCLPEIIRTVPHVAFEVSDIDSAVIDQEIILAPTSPSKGVRSAMILHNGAPVEVISFESCPSPNELSTSIRLAAV